MKQHGTMHRPSVTTPFIVASLMIATTYPCMQEIRTRIKVDDIMQDDHMRERRRKKNNAASPGKE